MKIAILGTGAMGSIYAALFKEAGNTVIAIDVWEEHVSKISKDGLIIDGPNGDRKISGIIASKNIDSAKNCDLYIISTKADDVGNAAKSISKLINQDSIVLTIQNGLGASERIKKYISPKNVLLGVAEGFGASIVNAGHVHHNAMRQIRIGEMNGGITNRLKKIEELWREAGFNANAYEDINQLIWEKFLCNVFLSAPCTVFECNIGGILNTPSFQSIALGCMFEAFEIGKLRKIKFSFSDPKKYVLDFAKVMPNANPSMRLDHLSRKKSEIDSINGIVPKLANRHGTLAPYNETLSEIIRVKESKFKQK